MAVVLLSRNPQVLRYGFFARQRRRVFRFDGAAGDVGRPFLRACRNPFYPLESPGAPAKIIDVLTVR